MNINNYNLKIGKLHLLKNVSIKFENNKVNHLLGKNGSGKSCFAKSLIGAIKKDGSIDVLTDDIVVVSSYSNIPNDLTTKDVINFSKPNNIKLYSYIYDMLDIKNIPNIKVKKLSDGQKQKLKLLYFLSNKSKIIILDEFTNALDKKSCQELYAFINEFIKHEDVTIINITHNLTDLENIKGCYYLLADNTIKQIESKEEVIELYIKG